jgi:hypothetical protein
MEVLNATYLFEDSNKERVWPASAESFWTTLFSLFILHLSNGTAPRGKLTIWHCTDGPKAPWYVPRSKEKLEFKNVTFDDITVEPYGLCRPFLCTNETLTAEAGGFSPDIVVRSRSKNRDHFVIIENKVTSGSHLAPNQIENYPCLMKWLSERKISFDFLILQSVGCCDALAEQTRFLQKEWQRHFGILLWEEVLREMKRTNFLLTGVPIDRWERYSKALDTDCSRRKA